MESEIKLTKFSSGSGCGCKIHPETLELILKNLKTDKHFPGLLVGNESSDDASVMQLPDGNLLIQTADFFTPIVDDPFLFGQIAAANALSDVYAMGGKPLMANALLGWPTDILAPEIANMVLQGAIAICNKINVPLAGGHSIKIQEPVFGLSVTGLCEPYSLKVNNGANIKDIIYITKPLGTGIIAAGLKRGQLNDEGYQELIELCTHLNIEGSFFGGLEYVHAMTDITGFGLLGHLLEMCQGSNLAARLSSSKIPVIESAKILAAQFVVPDNTYRNWNAFEKFTQNLSPDLFAIVNDPQTNGGLMVAVDEKHKLEFEQSCRNNNIQLYEIGVFENGSGVVFE